MLLVGLICFIEEILVIIWVVFVVSGVLNVLIFYEVVQIFFGNNIVVESEKVLINLFYFFEDVLNDSKIIFELKKENYFVRVLFSLLDLVFKDDFKEKKRVFFVKMKMISRILFFMEDGNGKWSMLVKK